MEDNIFSPVPKEQRPLNQYIELKNSFIFSWASNGYLYLYRNLILSWLVSLPIFITIGTGSFYLSNDFLKLITFDFSYK